MEELLGSATKGAIEYRRFETGQFFWGRVPLDRLSDLFASSYAVPSDTEYLDLGTPVRALGSGSTYDQRCRALLGKAADSPSNLGGRPAKVGAAIVDMGVTSLVAPDDYGGKLRHAVTSGVELSDHAEKVLSVLLDRLDHKGDLKDTTISCALVKPPSHQIGLGRPCFDQACTPEVLSALQALEPQLTADGIPVAVNMSLGTHVGPHNGSSPLEDYIATTFVTSDRYVVAAAGNEGGKGCSGKRTILANEPEYLPLRIAANCKEVLVEFWWDESSAKGVSIDADIYEIVGGGSPINHGTLTIDGSIAGSLLTTASIGLPGTLATHSLFTAKCQNNFSCIAFALSAIGLASALPQMLVRFKLEATQDVAVNSWIVIAEDASGVTAFVEGGPEGSISVPATEEKVLSVAGLRASGQMWEGSSRGPSAEYDRTRNPTGSPYMAHLADLAGGEYGTSFASPRACADAVVTLNSAKRSKCTDVATLLVETYGLKALPNWNPRFGYHKQKS
ncbi:hypothetical protein L6654_04680 [Bradyrhizobium sp. WYCCWR 13023]|uniref:Peptidase S8/S53 domain-containing protein n=1 Tax=Bradyrhizobium zhengyangense TaxID=2911009 RepID=A0A9X1R919_9BRAD|nr:MULTISPECIES: S8 family serine peptidase [Bradyrhizobium]MCG2625915.1 hypothetical protein [Bradyrhizobium zhengyangense]MCG2638528.1 hypothetical protein [Bradyrhizobium zhengyangense]MCG2666928.1 hypothetical protein [Bradyrhizobium zhengyangense]